MLRLSSAFPLLALSSAFFFASTANGQVRDEDTCLRLHPDMQSPVEMARCTSDIEGSEQRLETAYSALQRRMEPGVRRTLQKAQKAWFAYRNAECAYGAGGSGTARSSDIIFCTAEMNRARAKALEEDLARWPE